MPLRKEETIIESKGFIRYQKGPVSLESERRKAIILVEEVERNVSHFKNKWLKDATDDHVDSWIDLIALAKEHAGMPKCKTVEEFGQELIKIRKHEAMSENKILLNDMLKIAERAKMFDEMIPDIHNKLQRAFERVSKYCLSFSLEAENQDIRAIQDYENNILKWEEDIPKGLAEVNRKYHDYLEAKNISMEAYIETYGNILHNMTYTLESLPKICDPMRDWVLADETYPRKIMQEIRKIEKKKEEVSESHRRQFNRKNEDSSRVQRTVYNSKKVKDQLQNAMYERKQCRKREMAVQDNIDIIKEDMDEKKKELDDTLKQFNNRKSNSPTIFDILSAKVDTLHDEIQTLENQMKVHKRNMSRMKEDRLRVQKDIHICKKVHEKSLKDTQKVYEVLEREEHNAKRLAEQDAVLAARIKAAYRIRQIKLHPLTVKKIYLGGYVPGQMNGVTDHLSEALRVTAAEVGKNWTTLYRKLPFNPPRDKSNRDYDIEAIDWTRSTNTEYKDLAYKGLEKWRKLSNKASTNALIRTLNSMQKQSIAQQLQRTVIIT
ncbi:uncharacterized protein LOC127711143 [Mytilus californianus]|uniref:uncharacterized protein LOC127711143 n=1 Tax=Mytilus californianus TaxID=6549 RepID=UPI002245F08D|nr:uncharacterized protein LOC127711143 [Mytilus californianus]XP_052073054.1 uncharacterized protein LOC127711143 [Mytilus californianus]